MMQRVKLQSGFTLIELLLYVVIVGTLLTAVVGFSITAAQSRIKNQTIAEVDQQGILAMQQITQIVRNSSSISLPAAAATDSSLTVIVPTASLSPTVVNLSSGVLQIKEGTAAAIPLTNNKVTVSALSIQNLTRSGTPGVVQISFTIARTNTAGRNEFDYQKTFTTTASVRP